MTNIKERLIEEHNKMWKETQIEGFSTTGRNTVCDWWFSKRDTELKALLERVEEMKKPEIVIEDCENCGEEGYGKAWYGKGAENDPHGYGDRYYPTGSVVFCETCFNEHGKIGRNWNGEEIWKVTSTLQQHEETRKNYIKKKSLENVGWNLALTDISKIIKTLIGE